MNSKRHQLRSNNFILYLQTVSMLDTNTIVVYLCGQIRGVYLVTIFHNSDSMHYCEFKSVVHSCRVKLMHVHYSQLVGMTLLLAVIQRENCEAQLCLNPELRKPQISQKVLLSVLINIPEPINVSASHLIMHGCCSFLVESLQQPTV